MSLLTCPRFLSFSFSPNTLSFGRPRSRFPLAASKGAESSAIDDSVAVLWFKHDLRIDDHPGLVAAASRHRTVIPLYVFDRRILSRFSDEMLELVLVAMEDLRESLKDQGSNLMIRFGSAEKTIREIVKEVKATTIFAEEEVEHELRKMIDTVQETLATAPLLERSPEVVMWHTPFYDIKDLKYLPPLHHDFKKLQLPITSPLGPPRLPSVEIGLDWGPVPSLADLKQFVNGNPSKSKEDWTSIKETIAEKMLLNDQIDQAEPPNTLIGGMESLKSRGSNQINLNHEQTQRKRLQKSVFVTSKGNLVGGGTNAVLNALAAYLRYLEGTGRDDWQEVHEKLRNAESRDGASFGILFGSALFLGIISRRRVYHEAIKYEKERNAGFLSPFGYSAATIAAAADAVCTMEWYWLMALKSQISDEGPFSIRIWRWNGYLIQYTVVGHEGPAVLLVHGFGAFFEHYRDNIHPVADSGKRVWAITLLGFGKSEKPNVFYSELMWAELLRDFIIQVVGEPVHLVGNSIGGYFISIVAGLWPALAKSVILINSAGNVIPGYSSMPSSKERRTSGAAWLGARLLLPFLRLRLPSIVKNCYPAKMARADDWLLNEMLRSSYDPGVLVVLESIFSFNLSIPLNYLLKGFNEKVLFIQGVKDPISDSESKLAMLREHFAGIVIKELSAGHCPHDELPEEVNYIICDWIATIESKLLLV